MAPADERKVAVATTVKLYHPAPPRHDLDGFGGQFDCDLFTRRGQPKPCTDAQLVDLQKTVNRLKPGHSRIFVTSEVLEKTNDGKTEREALMHTIALADRAGASVNLTWWQGPYFAGVTESLRGKCRPRKHGAFIGEALMEGFAEIVAETRRQKHDCVKYVTIQNEVNNQDIGLECDVGASQQVYKRLYAILVRRLKARPDPLRRAPNLRRTVDLVAGDLLAGNSHGVKNSEQRHWMEFMQKNMAKLVDAYSIHVYWTPGDFAKIDFRLSRLAAQIEKFGIDKPIYVTEYGVRAPGKDHEPGHLDGQNIEDTVVAGFEHAWFNALAPQFGCVGLAKWALYRTDGPKRRFGGWGMISPPSARFRPQSPSYFVTWLFNHLADPGWRAAGLWRSDDKLALVSRFAAPKGVNHSLVALNRAAAPVELHIPDLKSHFPYFAAIWNRHGDPKPGSIHQLKRVPSNDGGVATVTVRPHEMLALSTRPIMR